MNRLFFSLLFLFCVSVNIQAARLYAGGQITYEHKGNGVYDIFLSVVYDCSGDSSRSDSLVFLRQGSGFSGSFKVGNGSKVSETDVTGYSDSCKGMSPCLGGNGSIGYKKAIYKFTYDLSQDTACRFYITWSDQNYSSNITTGLASQAFNLDAELNRCDIDHSSPNFIADFTPNLEYNQDAYVVYTCSGPSTDSLAYSLVNATGYGNGNGGYIGIRPVRFFGFPNQNLSFPAGFHITESGEVLFRPVELNQVGVICVYVEQWRKINGTMTRIGGVRRDMLVDIGSRRGNNQSPYFSNLPSSLNICDNDTQIRVLSTGDNDANDFTKIEVLKADSNLLIQVVDTGQYAQLLVRLRSGLALNTMVNAKFVVLVSDNACPFTSSRAKEFRFYIRPHVEGETQVVIDTLCGIAAYTGSNYKNVIKSDWLLTPQDTLLKAIQIKDTSVKLLPGTWYSRVQLTNLVCSVYDYDTFTIKPYVIPNLSINKGIYCPGTTNRLFAGVDTSFKDIDYYWSWKGGAQSDTLGYIDYPVDSNSVYLQTMDANGCINTDSLKLALFAQPTLTVKLDTSICWEGPYPLFHPFKPGNQYSWWDGKKTDTTHVDSSGTYWLMFSDKNGCSVTDSFSIELKGFPRVDLGPNKKFCSPDSLRISPSAAYASYSWNTGSTDSAIWFSQSGKVRLTVSNVQGCFAKDSVTLTRIIPTPLNLGPDAILCWTDSLFLDASQGFAIWYWKDGYNGSSRWISKQGNYELTALDLNGCSSYDAIYLAKVKPEVHVYGDTVMCQGDSVQLAIHENYPFVVWSTGDTANTSFVNYGGLTTVYIEDSTGCPTMENYYTWVNALPDASFSYTDLGQRQVQFTAAQSQIFYNWDFGDGNSSSIESPLHQFDSIQTYQVHLMVYDDFGCKDSSSQSVSFGTGMNPVSFHPMLLYPNPNRGKFTIDWEGPALQVQVIDQLGQTVAEFKLVARQSAIDLNLPAGIYVLRDSESLMKPLRFEVIGN